MSGWVTQRGRALLGALERGGRFAGWKGSVPCSIKAVSEQPLPGRASLPITCYWDGDVLAF